MKGKGKLNTTDDVDKLGDTSKLPVIKDNHFIINESQDNKEEEEIDDEALNDREQALPAKEATDLKEEESIDDEIHDESL
jgi:hypothetical protein